MLYYNVEKNEQGIYLIERNYDRNFLLKTESAFAQCNGYFGVRASFDTRVLEENRGMFVRGLFHTAYENDIEELVNCPDITEIQLLFDDEKFSIDTSNLIEYKRSMNLLTGELTLHIICRLNNGLEVKLTSRRFASYSNQHLFCQSLTITPLNQQTKVFITTGINGQVTNHGISHFNQTEVKVIERKYMQMNAFLKNQSLFIMNACSINPHKEIQPDFTNRRRCIHATYKLELQKDQEITFTKYNYIESFSVNNIHNEKDIQKILEHCIVNGYDALFEKHRDALQHFWKYASIKIEGASVEEEAGIYFSQYHLFGMTPSNNTHLSIAAKGLTGEGYYGHVFWDTEIFILPFFEYTFPEVARDLLEFRYHGLSGARAKAKEYGYRGAMFPWEVTNDGYEKTPLYAALNIHTGKANKVWSGIKEHHISADIIYAIWKYYALTRDDNFMQEFGYQVIFEVADFWVSRVVYDDDTGKYYIKDIIGPDEYTEHIDNNAFTNYMVYFSLDTACRALKDLKVKSNPLYQNLNNVFGLDAAEKSWFTVKNNIYLPQPNQDNIIPQDDTFLSKKLLGNIEDYKVSDIKQSILFDYNRDEIVDMQVLKQADVVMLFNLFPHMFSTKVIEDNISFYENRTIHDSSLSYCAHAQAFAAVGNHEMAMQFFEKAREVDLNDNPHDSNDGIHSAALGGIWNCVILGFAGVNYDNDCLEISPRLPQRWEGMEFFLNIRGVYIKVSIHRNTLMLTCEKKPREFIKVRVYDKFYQFEEILSVNF